MSLLNNLLISTSFPNEPTTALVPPPNIIALISTLLVHPSHTTRAPSRERLEVSSQSLVLLRNILNILGPLNANLAEAFIFKRAPRRGRKSGRKGDSTGRASPANDEEAINTALADESSIWQRAQDFWNVIGWAFNCSAKLPKRWEYWRIWLKYMLDVLDADWDERSRLDEDSLENCMLMRYLLDAGTSSSMIRRVVKSVVANGDMDDSRAYPEVFDNETRDWTTSVGGKRKREFKVDLEVDKYGDYVKDEDDEFGDILDSSQPQQSLQDLPTLVDQVSGQDTSSTAILMGGPEAVILRLRVLALVGTILHNEPDLNITNTNQLSRAAYTFPESWIDIVELYSIFWEILNPLPLPMFSLFLSMSARPHLPDEALSSLAQLHLLRLLPSGTRTPPTDELSQENLERCFLPATGNTSSTEDNAKVSLLVETLFRLFVTTCGAENSPELAAAVEGGIVAREKKCNDRRKKAGWAKNDANMILLNASARRIRLVLQFIQEGDGTLPASDRLH